MSTETRPEGISRAFSTAMAVICSECGYKSEGGAVLIWLNNHDDG